MSRQKQRTPLSKKTLLKGKASLFVSSSGQWVPEFDHVLVKLEKHYYNHSYSYILQAEDDEEGANDVGIIFGEELSIPFKIERRDGHFVHFPTEEYHIGLSFINETTALQLVSTIDDINFLEKKKYEDRKALEKKQAKSLRKPTKSGKERPSGGTLRRSEKDYDTRSESGTLSRNFRRRPSRSHSIQKSLHGDLKQNKSDYLIGYENRSMISYGSEDSISYSERDYRTSFRNDDLNQSGYSTISSQKHKQNDSRPPVPVFDNRPPAPVFDNRPPAPVFDNRPPAPVFDNRPPAPVFDNRPPPPPFENMQPTQSFDNRPNPPQFENMQPPPQFDSRNNRPPQFDTTSISSTKSEDSNKQNKNETKNIKGFLSNLFNKKTFFKTKSNPDKNILPQSSPAPHHSQDKTNHNPTQTGNQPPPPPPPPFSNNNTQSTGGPPPPPFNPQSFGQQSSGGGPPPPPPPFGQQSSGGGPPPPPFMAKQPQLAPQLQSKPKPKQAAPPAADGNSELLDSIRMHAKKGLKKVQTVNKTDGMFDKDKSAASSGGGGQAASSGNAPVSRNQDMHNQLNFAIGRMLAKK